MRTKLRKTDSPIWSQHIRDVANFICENTMVSNPGYVLKHWDRKYIDLRVDMRTGAVLVKDNNGEYLELVGQ